MALAEEPAVWMPVASTKQHSARWKHNLIDASIVLVHLRHPCIATYQGQTSLEMLQMEHQAAMLDKNVSPPPPSLEYTLCMPQVLTYQ